MSKKPLTEDKTKHVPQAPKLKDQVEIKVKHKLTEKQQKLIDIILDKKTKCVFVSGPAGTSKTFLAIYCGLELLNRKQVSDIIYVRSIVESSDAKIGFLPGDIDTKIQPYMEPLLDKLSEVLSSQIVKKLVDEGRIQSKSTSFLRGLNWNAKFITFDEANNATEKEIVTTMTRIGEFSKLILCGDPMQSDINGKSGFKKMYDIFNSDDSRENGIHCFEFGEEDIVRSEFVRFVVNKLNIYKKTNAH